MAFSKGHFWLTDSFGLNDPCQIVEPSGIGELTIPPRPGYMKKHCWKKVLV